MPLHLTHSQPCYRASFTFHLSWSNALFHRLGQARIASKNLQHTATAREANLFYRNSYGSSLQPYRRFTLAMGINSSRTSTGASIGGHHNAAGQGHFASSPPNHRSLHSSLAVCQDTEQTAVAVEQGLESHPRTDRLPLELQEEDARLRPQEGDRLSGDRELQFKQCADTEGANSVLNSISDEEEEEEEKKEAQRPDIRTVQSTGGISTKADPGQLPGSSSVVTDLGITGTASSIQKSKKPRKKAKTRRAAAAAATASTIPRELKFPNAPKTTKRQRKIEKRRAAAASVSVSTSLPPQSSPRPPPLQQPPSTPSLPTMVPPLTALPPRPPRKKSPKRAPSLASGGVPTPTESYLSQTLTPPERLPNARQILIVLDLNGTVLHRPDAVNNPKDARPRPHAKEFLTYIISTFPVLVWSSSMPHNVDRLTQSIVPSNLRHKLAGVWGRDRFGLAQDQYRANVQCYKRLTTVWDSEAVQRMHPDYERGGRWDQTNTVLVDDSAEKARAQPFNLVEVPEFASGREEEDIILPQVHDYINELSCQEDISRYIRANPFKGSDQWKPQFF